MENIEKCQSTSESENIFRYKIDLLKDEINRTQTRIQIHDDLRYRVKQWTIIIWSAVVGIAIKEHSIIFLASLFPVLLASWILETVERQGQRRHVTRMRYLESFINGSGKFKLKTTLDQVVSTKSFDTFAILDPILMHSIKIDPDLASYCKKDFSFFRSFMKRSVLLTYFLLMLCTIILIFVCQL